jgi:hypothetical protein
MDMTMHQRTSLEINIACSYIRTFAEVCHR